MRCGTTGPRVVLFALVRRISVIRDDLLSDEAAEVFAIMVRSRMEQLGAKTGASVMVGRQERLKEGLQRLVDAVRPLASVRHWLSEYAAQSASYARSKRRSVLQRRQRQSALMRARNCGNC